MLLQHRKIDYKLLVKAIEFYEARQIVQVEVPWIVGEEASDATSPTGDLGIAMSLCDYSRLVCSAEQGFIQLGLRDQLVNVPQMAVSPCFRNEALDETHSKYFMKLELFWPGDGIHGSPFARAEQFALLAQEFHAGLGLDTKIVVTDIGYDLMCGDLELGSYGVRDYANICAAYGTGLALPRTSLALARR